ncbi:hypothetical protein ACJIZ3_010056 [Penstemon smallii]|uniref:CDT1 Geminin-binding domain-containing protein n=1 Tax=Penstemon smallii TaxID=265156 RepID=A0ABD3TF55_9LAMI
MDEIAKEKTVSVVQSSSKSPKKEGIIETHHLEEETFSSPTPAKTKEPSRCQRKSEIVELPEKYGNLLDFFNRMSSSLRLLNLRKKTPTFQNISSQVEILTERKFSFKHLAQMKHILPEAIQVDKILLHDEQTKCMIPDMKVALVFDIVEGHCEESVFVALSNLFSSRLREFCISHDEDSDVPEAVLPEPFNQRNITIKEEPTFHNLSATCETEILNPSHFPPSFKRHFNHKAIASGTEQSDLPSDIKFASVANEDNEKSRTFLNSSSEASEYEKTPIKLPSKSGSILVETSVQSTPARPISPKASVLTCEDDKKSTANQISQQPTTTVKKSLDFSSMSNEDTTISHKKTSVCSSDLVLLIHQIFKSVKFSPITKQELVQKIIMYDCEIDEQSEVETQMEHLEKLVPDWFFKKLAPSGDFLYNVKKVSDLNSICERISVA